MSVDDRHTARTRRKDWPPNQHVTVTEAKETATTFARAMGMPEPGKHPDIDMMILGIKWQQEIMPRLAKLDEMMRALKIEAKFQQAFWLDMVTFAQKKLDAV